MKYENKVETPYRHVTYMVSTTYLCGKVTDLMKGALEELGEEVDDDVVSISKMQTQILNMTHGQVNIFDDEGEFRNIYDIMKEISKVYDTLNSTEQAKLLETIAGKRFLPVCTEMCTKNIFNCR